MLSNHPPDCPCDNEECATLTGIQRLRISSETSFKLKIFHYAAGLTRIVGLVFVILFLVWTLRYREGFSSYPNSLSNFNWHSFPLAFGMIFLYSNAMLVYKTEQMFGKQRYRRIHGAIMALCIISTIPGIAVSLGNHSFRDRFRKWNDWQMDGAHFIIGYISLILFYIQCLVGIVSSIFPRIEPYLRAAYVGLGTGGFVGCVLSFFLAFNKEAFFALEFNPNYLTENTIISFILLTLITFGGLSVYLFSCNCYKFFVTPDEERPSFESTVSGNRYSQDRVIHSLPKAVNDGAHCSKILSSEPDPNILVPVDTSLPRPRLNNLNNVD